MQISLPADLEHFVQEQVKTGQFASLSEIVTHALRTLRFQQESLPKGDALAQLIAEGQAEADRGELLDGESAFHDLLDHNARRFPKA